jgi:zinc protease
MKKICPILVLLLGLLTAPALAGEIPLSLPYTQFTLANGLRVILHRDPTIPMVCVDLWYHVGSSREKPGRTGLAHLFEHIMFEGSAHVPEGKFDEWLASAGGENNGSTSLDRTNYYEVVPKNALELALFLESDRMGYLLAGLTPAKVDGQRDVVKNERRQSYENRPYGQAKMRLFETLFPADHPYHWPTIGYMPDLTAAAYEDIRAFFQSYYVPNNASLVVAGDIDIDQTRELVKKWFAAIPRGPDIAALNVPQVQIRQETRLVMPDRVQLPRLYLAWVTPALFQPGDAELDLLAQILSGGKNSRLFRRLVYELQIAQDVSAYQASARLASTFQISVTPRPGHSLAEMQKIIQEEIDRLKQEPPQPREVERAMNQYEASFLDQLESVGGFSGKADMLNHYFFATGNPDYFNEDLMRYKAIGPNDIQNAAITYLRDNGRVILEVVPQSQETSSPQAPKAEPATQVKKEKP